jgi:hypothetical protein
MSETKIDEGRSCRAKLADAITQIIGIITNVNMATTPYAMPKWFVVPAMNRSEILERMNPRMTVSRLASDEMMLRMATTIRIYSAFWAQDSI